MSTKLNDGGPAFPLDPEIGKAHFDDPMAYPGMSLRDWFAGQALPAKIADAESWNDQQRDAGAATRLYPGDVAASCYEYADAMIAARKGQQ